MKPGNSSPIAPDLKAELDALAAMPDDTIDTSEIAPVTDWFKERRGVFYQPASEVLSLRLDADVVAWFKATDANGYQARMNAALREHMERHHTGRS